MTKEFDQTPPAATGPISVTPQPTPLPPPNPEDTPDDGNASFEVMFLTTDGRYINENRQILDTLESYLPLDVLKHLRKSDGAYRITEFLRSTANPSDKHFDEQYFYVAQYYNSTGRQEVAAYVYWQQYIAIQNYEQLIKRRWHKGYPLVRLSEIYEGLGWGSLAERYRMLTLVEDAIEQKGHCDREGGVFWRLWPRQIANQEAIETHFKVAYENLDTYNKLFYCPEAILQDLGEGWGQRVPEGIESSQWVFNRHYYTIMWEKIKIRNGDAGKVLERLASYLMSCIPGVTTRRRAITSGTDLDVFCSFEGALHDFRADLGRHWICECKDTEDSVGFADIAKFGRVLDASRCKAGVLFAPAGISGAADAWYAAREITKLFQQHGIAILVVEASHLERIGKGESLISILRSIYEQVRHDLWKEPLQEKTS